MSSIRSFKVQGASAHLNLQPNGEAALMSVYSRYPRTGNGTLLMRKICTYADTEGLRLVLRAKPFNHGALTKEQLVSFYEKFGFNQVEHDREVGTLMIREPGSSTP